MLQCLVLVFAYNQVNELKSQSDHRSQSLLQSDFFLEEDMMSQGSGTYRTKSSNIEQRHKEQIRRMDREKKEEKEVS